MKFNFKNIYNSLFARTLATTTTTTNPTNLKKNGIKKSIPKRNIQKKNITKKDILRKKKLVNNSENDEKKPTEGKVVKRKKKEKIPKAIREQVWLKYIGQRYSTKCNIVWCKNKINCFNFDCGHNIPESKGGELRLNNLRPICRNCNVSMGANYSIDEWNSKFKPNKRWYFFYLF